MHFSNSKEILYYLLLIILCIFISMSSEYRVKSKIRTTPALFKWFEMLPSKSYKTFRKRMKKVKNLLVITGGGISAEVGLPTYTEHINYWRDYNLLTVTDVQTFYRNPSVVWEFYHNIRERALKAKPSTGHLVLVELEKKMEKAGRNFSILTTNIDGLHQLAGSKRVTEMHGSVIRTKCIECHNVEVNKDSPIVPALVGREFCDQPLRDYPVIPEHDLPRCKKKGCGGLLRPDIIFYSEHIKAEDNLHAKKLMAACDFCIVIGTSYNIVPVGMWPYQIAKSGIPVAEFNTEFSKFTADFKFIFRGTANETLPKALGKLKFDDLND